MFLLRMPHSSLNATSLKLVHAVIVIDVTCTIRFCNESEEKLFQWTRFVLMGQTMNTLMNEKFVKVHDIYVNNYSAMHNSFFMP